MQCVSNQLNKVKTVDGPKECTIQAGAASAFLGAILEDARGFSDKKVVVFSCSSGMLAVGAGLLSPQSLTVVLDRVPDAVLSANLKKFKIEADVVVGGLMPFGEQCFDISIVAPVLSKARGVQLKDIKNAVKVSKVAYALHRVEFKDKLLAEFPGAETRDSILLRLPGSSHYSKNGDNAAQFSIVKVKSM